MIKLEITADSVEDFLAQIAVFSRPNAPVPQPVTIGVTTAADATMPEVKTAETVKATPAKKTPVKAEAPKEPAKAPTEPAKGNGAAELNFNDDVAPVVVGFLEKHGKPAVLQVLSAFSVERASEVPPQQWPQLIAAIGAADAAAA